MTSWVAMMAPGSHKVGDEGLHKFYGHWRDLERGSYYTPEVTNGYVNYDIVLEDGALLAS